MLKPLALAAMLLGISPAIAQTTTAYLIFPTQAACLARSKQQCVINGCDGVKTVYWWSCAGPLSAGLVGPSAVGAGSYALAVQPTPYDQTGLTTAETNKLVTPAQIAGVLPVIQTAIAQ